MLRTDGDRAAAVGTVLDSIHAVQILYTILGKACKKVTVSTNETYDLVKGETEDGCIGTVRGNRTGSYKFGALVHTLEETLYADVNAYPKPFYASFVEKIVEFIKMGEPVVEMEDDRDHQVHRDSVLIELERRGNHILDHPYLENHTIFLVSPFIYWVD